MLSRKRLIIISITLNLLFFISAAVLIGQNTESESSKKTKAVIQIALEDLHTFFFDTSKNAERILKAYYKGELTQKELLASFIANNIPAAVVIESGVPVPLINSLPLADVPKEFYTSADQFYIHPIFHRSTKKDPSAHFAYSTRISLPTNEGVLKNHILTFSIMSRKQRLLRKLYNFSITIIKFDKNLSPQILQTTLLENLVAPALKEISLNTSRYLKSKKPLYSGDPIPPFTAHVSAGESLFFLPIVLSATESSHLFAVYSIPTNDLVIDSSKRLLLLLIPFLLLSLLITGAMYYLSRP
ncbi:MAG: hypothetical protein IT287_06895 [Bdellovibrionaceae bacterium]|nr:hypothetical protein [Pseudobdellovibrionaceae bacterium]